jgi:hypothetical protein
MSGFRRCPQIGKVTLPQEIGWIFCVSGGRMEKFFLYESMRVRSIVLSVDEEGTYSIFAEHEALSGYLSLAGDSTSVYVPAGGLFIANAHFIPIESRTPLRSRTQSPDPIPTSSNPVDGS